jgi:hypothetical protein
MPNEAVDTGQLSASSSSVQGYLAALQGTISRMASNSANCKTWCITAVSALLVAMVEKEDIEPIRVLLVPIVMFGLLDAYYLGLERVFRERYDKAVQSLAVGVLTSNELFRISPELSWGAMVMATTKALMSFSVAPVYLLLLGMLSWALRTL